MAEAVDSVGDNVAGTVAGTADKRQLVDELRARWTAFRSAFAAAPWGRLTGTLRDEAILVLEKHPQWGTAFSGAAAPAAPAEGPEGSSDGPEGPKGPALTVMKLHKASDPKQAVLAFRHVDGTCHIVSVGECFKAMLRPARPVKEPKGPKRPAKSSKLVVRSKSLFTS